MNKIGFGFLRLPLLPGKAQQVDLPLTIRLVDTFLQQGGRYFDTAYNYLQGNSEKAIGAALASRYPREQFLLADKLPGFLASTAEDSRRFFDQQLQRCQVEYFDVYLLHWLNRAHYQKAEALGQFAFLQQLKEQKLARRIGFSFHDSAAVLDEILRRHPEVDYVQLQINYLDWDSDIIQSRQCYEVALRHGKKVLVMEPVKGGTLAALPPEAQALLDDLSPAAPASPASYALRFAQSLPGVEIVLSGMNSLLQVEENLRPIAPLSPREEAALEQIAQLLHSRIAIPCTDCGYCLSYCPRHIAIPRYFSLYNEYSGNPGEVWKLQSLYHQLGEHHGKASDCVGCRSCEVHCPQGIPISRHLSQITKVFF